MKPDDVKKLDAAKKAQERRRAIAYATVFGTPGKRTDAQKIVWDDMERGSFAFRSTMAVDEGGRVDPMKMAANEGRRSWLNEIKDFIRQSTGV
jgi:hypothetical protein